MASASFAEQQASAGKSDEPIVNAVLEAARPERGLRWLDIGCGTGDLLRRIRDEWEPLSLAGVDALPWLDPDLADDVDFHEVSADVADMPVADRVLMVETIEHLEAPWTSLRRAAQLVAPNGWLVVSTPNVATLRHRLDLSVRGQLTSFRPDNEPHLTPALPHVTSRILASEGLQVQEPLYAAADVVPFTGGRHWPEAMRLRFPRPLSISVIVAGSRPASQPS